MKPFNVIIIGSGLGGLACGIRLATEGCRVKILEKNTFPGGSLGTIRANGFQFNYGAEYVAAPFLFDQLFELAGKHRIDYFKFRECDPAFQAIFPDWSRFAFYANPYETEQYNLWNSPVDLQAFHDFNKETAALFDEVFFDYCSKAVDESFLTLRQNLWIRRLDWQKTCAELAETSFENPFLRQFFGFWPLLAGGNPKKTSHLFRLSAELFHRWGTAVPDKGMDDLVQSVVRLFHETGGEIVYNAEVSEIQIFNRTVSGVRLRDGSIQQADLVVSDVDAAAAYQRLIDSDRTKYAVVEQAKNKRVGCGFFVYHLGTRRVLEEKTSLAPLNILFPENYDRFLDDLFDRNVVSADPLIFLRIPSKVHEEAAPAGCEALTAMIPVPNLSAVDSWTRDSYAYRNHILDLLQQYFVTDIRTNLVVEKFTDPSGYQKTLGTAEGAAFSFLPVIQRNGEIRMANRSKDIRNLYLVGAGAHPGASIPGVLLGAATTAELIKQDFSSDWM